MDLIKISIQRPVFAWVLFIAVVFFGAFTATKLGVSQLPDVDFPILNISMAYEGAAPEVIEADIIEPIETALLAVEGIKEMKSTVRQGQGSIQLEFDIKKNVDVALQEVQSNLSQVRLPADVDPPVIRKQNPEDSPILFLGVYSDKPISEILEWTDSFLLDQFRFIPDVADVGIGGFAVRNMRVWPDPVRLRRNDLTVIDVLDAIQSQHMETSAGQFSNGQIERRTRWLGEATNASELSELRILRRGGSIIQPGVVLKIKDVATVEDGLSDIRRRARLNGKEAVVISVRKQRGTNEVAVAKAVQQKVDELQSRLPEGYHLLMNVDFTRPTEASVETTYHKLFFAGLITIIICFLFLGSIQAAINILFSVPFSIVGTFFVLYFAGFTLNLFTLLALTLAVSIVVDDAIMLLENIIRHYRMGKSPALAAYEGSKEILPAATAATFAVLAVFLPVVFMEGITGKFFFQFGVAMSTAVVLSLLEAVTVTPMRTALFLNSSPKVSNFEKKLDHLFEGFANFYRRFLDWVLSHSWIVVLGSTALFVTSLILINKVKQEFVPQQDQDILIISGNLPPGTALGVTYEMAKKFEEVVLKDPAVERMLVSIGAGGPSADVNSFFMPVVLKSRETRNETHLQVMERLRKSLAHLKGVRFSLRDISSRGLTSGRQFPVSFNISGPDLETLVNKSKEIIDRLNSEELTQDLDVDFKFGLPELLIRPDRVAMANFGVSSEAIARTLNATVGGIRTTRFTDDGRRYDVRVKLPEKLIRSPEDIDNIYVRNNAGNQISLAKLVKFEERNTYQAIYRSNRQRNIGVSGNLRPGKSQGAVLARAEAIAKEVLPPGYGFKLEGAAAGLTQSFQSLTMALVLGIFVAYLILAVQFNSFIHPVSVLVALPFSVTGALLTLWLTGVSLNLFSFIGLIVLMGIAKKNSILLVEFTNHVRQHGESNIRKALVEACPVRLRPILMTSVATVVAAVPLIIGNSIGQETRTPLGLTIIGGTVVSTVFTLFVVPCIYLLLSRLEAKKKTGLSLDSEPRSQAETRPADTTI